MTKARVFVFDLDVMRSAATKKRLELMYGDQVHVEVANTPAQATRLINEKTKIPLALTVVDYTFPRLEAGRPCIESVAELAPTCRRLVTVDFNKRREALDTISRRMGSTAVGQSVVVHGDEDSDFEPAVRDLIGDWQMVDAPATRIVKLYGPRWSPKVHELKEWFHMADVPFRWVAEDEQQRPGAVVVLPNGRVLANPDIPLVATALGVELPYVRPIYDVVIVGAGPGGMAAAIYSASGGLKTAVFERDAPGGQAGHSSLIENLIGFPEGLSGADLAERAHRQLLRLGAELVNPVEVTGMTRQDDGLLELSLSNGCTVLTKSMVLATGVTPNILDVPGAQQYLDKGVYQGASTAETNAYQGEVVTIVGGANSAGQATMNLAGSAAHVHLIVRDSSITVGMSDYLVKRIRKLVKDGRVTVHENTVVSNVIGDATQEHVAQIELSDRSNSAPAKTVDTTGVFVFIGAGPHTQWLPDIKKDARGFAEVGQADWAPSRSVQATSMPGVFAIGDAASGSAQRVGWAAGSGAKVSQELFAFVESITPALIQTSAGPTAVTVPLDGMGIEAASNAVEKMLKLAHSGQFYVHEVSKAHTTTWQLRDRDLGPKSMPVITLTVDGDQQHASLTVSALPGQLLGAAASRKGQLTAYAGNLGAYASRLARQSQAEPPQAEGRAVA